MQVSAYNNKFKDCKSERYANTEMLEILREFRIVRTQAIMKTINNIHQKADTNKVLVQVQMLPTTVNLLAFSNLYKTCLGKRF